MILEDVHNFRSGAPSIYVEYHRRSAVALVATGLEDPSDRHRSVSINLVTHQISHLGLRTPYHNIPIHKRRNVVTT